MKKILLGVCAALVLLMLSCADSKRQAVRVGDRFMNALVVELDTAVLMKYSTEDARRFLAESFRAMDSVEIAETRRAVKEGKNKFKLDEQKSIFGKSIASLVYEVYVGPEYEVKSFAKLEVMRFSGGWKVTLYVF